MVTAEAVTYRRALEINGEWQAKQTLAGETDSNSGDTIIFLSPGVRHDLNGLRSKP